MIYRKFGRTGWEISEIGFGAWGISGKQWIGATDAESLAALERSFHCGLNFVDTALAYGEGHSERLVGHAIRTASHWIYVGTKVPPKNRLWPARPGIPIEEVFPYDYIIESTETSLRNLALDCVDLLQLHVWNPEWIGSDVWRRAFETLKHSGKVRAVGVSINDHQPDSALELVRTGLVDSVQVIYNIFDQSPETNLFPLCQELQVAVLARVPLDEGGLTGSIDENTVFPPDDFRNHYFQGGRKKQVADRVRALQADLAGVEGTLAEIALRFTISHPAVTSVIPGMRKLPHVESNCALSTAGPLPGPVLERLRQHVWLRNFYD